MCPPRRECTSSRTSSLVRSGAPVATIRARIARRSAPIAVLDFGGASITMRTLVFSGRSTRVFGVRTPCSHTASTAMLISVSRRNCTPVRPATRGTAPVKEKAVSIRNPEGSHGARPSFAHDAGIVAEACKADRLVGLPPTLASDTASPYRRTMPPCTRPDEAGPDWSGPRQDAWPLGGDPADLDQGSRVTRSRRGRPARRRPR